MVNGRPVRRAKLSAKNRPMARAGCATFRSVAVVHGRTAITMGTKIAGTLNSTGTRSYFLDATKAVHGDLGMVHHHDVVFALSQSGETEELVKLLPSLR